MAARQCLYPSILEYFIHTLDAMLVHLTEESGWGLFDDGILGPWGELVPPVRALVFAVQLK